MPVIILNVTCITHDYLLINLPLRNVQMYNTGFFYVLLTVHPCIKLQIKPTWCTIFLPMFISFFYVSDDCVPIIRRNNCIYATLGTDYTSQQDFGTRKVYCVSNVTSHAESKYAIKIFSSPTVFVQWPFNYWFFGIFGIFISVFLYMNKYFKSFWTEGGHIQFTVIISLVVCGQTQEVNEIMRQTLIHVALNLERLGRHGTFKSWALCLER